MVELSGNLLFAAFLLYLAAIFFFGGTIRQKKGLESNPEVSKNPVSGLIGIILTILGFLAHLGYFVTRWIAAGHAPVSNMYEFITFFSLMFIGGFILMYFLYRTSVLGLFALPIALLIIAYGSMFPRDIAPLIPSLKSRWLMIHVMTTAFGQGILAISFVAALIYLVKFVGNGSSRKKFFWLETILFILAVGLGFVFATTSFSLAGYESEIHWMDKTGKEEVFLYTLPPIIGPNEGIVLTAGRMEPLLEVPAFIHAKKLNTVLWSVLAGALLYLFLRILFRKPLGEKIHPFTRRIRGDLLDEISYRSVLIGFPVFTLGALIFGMIWAQTAWSRFWNWDPKEVWALITWLFYAAFLHLRLSRGWHGEKSAWLAVIGFGIIMFNLIFVNLVIAGLHSYA